MKVFINFKVAILFVLIVLVFLQYLSAGLALLAGLIFALTFGNPIREYTQKWAGVLLKASVIGLGFGLNLQTLWVTTQQGLGLTISTIAFAMIVGLLLGKVLGVETKLSQLISTGTAICGGSAIAAMAPTIRAKQEQTVVAISIVFILNGIALYVYPWLGHMMHLTQQQFGLWAALGIHDTSSVVGAASEYGQEALSIATTTKLARALWIIPLVLLASWHMARKTHEESHTKVKLPVFILFFILASAATTFLPLDSTQLPLTGKSIAGSLVFLAKAGLITSLLFMGAGFTRATIKTLSPKPMMQAVILWLSISTGSILAILHLSS